VGLQFTTTAGALRSVLQTASKVAATKNTLSILSCVLLTADESGVTVAATDLEVGLLLPLDAEITEPGVIAAHARPMLAVAKNIPPNTPVTVQAEKGSLGLTLTYGPTSTRFFTMPTHEFPKRAGMTKTPRCEFTLPTETLRRLLRTVDCAASDETQYFLNGILFDVSEKGIHTVGTNIHILGMQRVPVAGVPSDKQIAMILPVCAVSAIESVLPAKNSPPSVHIQMGEVGDPHPYAGQFRFQAGDAVVSSRAVDGEYPAWQLIIAKDRNEYPCQPVVESAALLRALLAVGPTTNPKTLSVHCRVDADKLTLETSCPDFGSSTTTIPVLGGVPSGMEPHVVAFKTSYAQRSLQFLNSDTVQLQMPPNALSAIFVTPYPSDGNSMTLIMPMRIE